MRQDILLNETGDVSCFELTPNNISGEAQLLEQDKRSVVLSVTGDYLTAPDIGLNAIDFLHESGSDSTFCREVNKQCSAAGMNVERVKLEGNNLIIDAIYEN